MMYDDIDIDIKKLFFQVTQYWLISFETSIINKIPKYGKKNEIALDSI